MSEPEGVNDLGTVNVDGAGVIWHLYYRICDGTRIQYVWVPDLPPQDLAQVAFDLVSEQIEPPTITLSPPASAFGVVNVPTWLAVTPMADESATAGPLPTGLSATTIARVVAIEWDTGDPEVGVIRCEPWGEIPDDPEAEAPCSWTPTYPSTPEFGIDGVFEGSVTAVWQVTWAANDGSSGDLGELRTTTPVSYWVREIQTVGTRG